MQRILIPLVLLALAGIVMLFVKIGQLEDTVLAMQQEPMVAQKVSVETDDEGHDEEGEEEEVAVYMSRMHLYAQKLWAAGNAGDLELARFYQHEVEEVMEEVGNAGIIHDSIDVSAQMKVYGIPAIERLEHDFDTKGLDGFASAYDALIGNCNACHAVTDHDFIRIVVPVQVPQGQDFSPAR